MRRILPRIAVPRIAPELVGLAIATLMVAGCYDSRIGATELDAGVTQPTVDAATFRDAGDGAVIRCRDEVASFVGPGCAASTRECVSACAPRDTRCVDACIARDGSCSACMATTLIVCANGAGCQGQWDAFACCAQSAEGCGGRSGSALIPCGEACEAELVAYNACVSDVSGVCEPETAERCGLID